ncbi:hypothetical protein [Aliarcobacter butzleri]|uniref:hypothetical protein n=1 Tax=Aliarcobacter butzleri TaxID=28197 RepID=UPI003AF54AA1
MDKKEIEQNNKVEIKYEDSFVAFLDVLGFTDLVMNDKTDKINIYLNQVEKMIEIIKDRLKPLFYCNNINFIVISDSIIVSIPKNSNYNKDILQILCISIYSLQSYLATFDIWLRGAISSGKSYFNKEKNQIIGKAYINAYLLESKISNSQVILDNKIIKELGFTNSRDFINIINDGTENEVLYNWNNTSHIKRDFPLFINYLGIFINDSNNITNDMKIKCTKMIVENIENNIYSHVNLYTKYKWVANYALSLIDKSQNNKFNEFKERLEKL